MNTSRYKIEVLEYEHNSLLLAHDGGMATDEATEKSFSIRERQSTEKKHTEEKNQSSGMGKKFVI